MKVIAHFRYPTGMAYPDTDWIMDHLENIGFILSPNEYNALKRSAVLTEEINDILPAQISYIIDHEEIENDPEEGIQDIFTYNTVTYP